MALKIPHRSTGSNYRRFLSEVEILRRLGNRAGIVPIVDAHAPVERESGAPWLALREATCLVEYLGDDPAIEQVVAVFAELAGTLAGLHSEEVFHRDIKPSNLYCLDGLACLGDFGLVSYPGKDDLTTDNRRLGPQGFQAPETLNTPQGAKGGPVDVHALAKTAWVMLTGQRYPLPGPIHRSERLMRLSQYVDHPAIRELEPALERATTLDPAQRMSMAEFTRELTAWRTEPRSAGPVELASLGRRFDAATADSARALKARQQRAHEALEVRHAMTARIRGMRDQLLEQGFATAAFHDGNNFTAITYAAPESHRHDGQGSAFTISAPGVPSVLLVLGFGCSVDAEAREICVCAAHMLRENGTWVPLWKNAVTAPTESVESHRLAARISAEFLEQVRQSLATFVAKVEQLRASGS